jgi:hypothetical protein
MARVKTKPVALAGGIALLTRLMVMSKLRRPKPKPKRAAKALKIGIPSLLAIGAGGAAIFKKKKGGGGKSRNFSLVGGAGPAPATNSQTRPGTTPPAPTPPPATEAKK